MSVARKGGAVTIANADTKSDPIHCKNADLVGLLMPAAFTGASVSFETSNTSDGTFSPVYDSAGVLVSATAGTNRIITLPPSATAAFLGYVKVVSAQAEAAERSIIPITRNLTP